MSFVNLTAERRTGVGTYKCTTGLQYTRWALLGVFLLSVIAGRCLPLTWAWENGPLEWMQVAVLGVGMLLCWVRARGLSAAGEPRAARFWVWATPAWLFFIGRELSWGRVFFPVGVGEKGPYFTPMADLRFGYLVHPIIIVLILLWLINIIRYGIYKVPFSLMLEKLFPVSELVITAAAFACSLYAAKYVRFPLMEESIETAAYLGLVAVTLQMKLRPTQLYKRAGRFTHQTRQSVL